MKVNVYSQYPIRCWPKANVQDLSNLSKHTLTGGRTAP